MPTITVKLLSRPDTDVSVSSFSITVRQLKEECEKVVEIPSEEQRIVFAGKILKDEDKLETYGIQEGVSIHIVRSKRSKPEPAPSATSTTNQPRTGNETNRTETQPSTNPYSAFSSSVLPEAAQGMGGMSGIGGMGGLNGLGGMGGMNGLGGMGGFGTPEQMQQTLSNPMVREMMRQMLPTFAQSNPMLANLPPELLQQQMDLMLSNPELMRLAMQNSPYLGGMGGANGVNPMGGNITNGTQGLPNTGLPNNAFQPNNFITPPLQGDPREIYRQQLQEMREMGFPNEEANIIALQQAQGNISFAVDRLLNGH